MDKIDCTTCKYGYEDERLGIPMCHHPKRFSEDCVDFNMHEEKHLEDKSDKSLEVNLEKELKKWRHEHFRGKRDDHYSGEYLERSTQLEIARRFYELGKNSK